MTAGFSTTRGHAMLNIYRSTAYSAITAWVKLHTGDPGAAGTSNASAVTTRRSVTFAAPSANSMAMSSMSGTWAMTGTETITHISVWDASTAGNFQESWALTSSVPVVNGSTFSLSALTLNVTPSAA